jgi:hypothetical protein
MRAGSSSVRRRSALALTAVATLVVVAAPAAHAAPVPERLYACVTPKFKTLNLTTKDARCANGSQKVTWQVEGQRGKAGDKGKPGAKGDKGDKGDTGAKGDTGTSGSSGAAGAKGETGANGSSGSADTAQDVLAKLLTVDGAGSGLDADLLGGIPSSSFQQRVSGTCAAGSYVREIAANGTVTCETTSAGITAPLTLAGTDTDPAIELTMPNSSGQRAISIDNDGVGPSVYAEGPGNAIWGKTESVSSAAVIGDSSYGEVVVGRANGAVCDTYIGKCNGMGAVVGRHDGQGGYGVRGFVTDPLGGIGVIGQAGISGGTGSGGRFENVNAANTSNALEAITNASGGTALFAQGVNAATFNGKVQINGDLTVTGTKSGFKIDDPRAPQQRTLTHTPVETDTLTVTYSGNVRTDAKGRAIVKLPAYAETLARDWRYQLTPIGQLGQAIVEREVKKGQFVVRTEHPRTKVSWNVIGTRRDPQAKQHAIEPVTTKSGEARGTYLDPSLYGQPASRATSQALPPTESADSAKLPSER